MSGEYLNQYITQCRYCGRQIVMTLTDQGWEPCDPVMMRFTPAGGPGTFITHDGKIWRGKPDRNGQIGYRKHYATCRRQRGWV